MKNIYYALSLIVSHFLVAPAILSIILWIPLKLNPVIQDTGLFNAFESTLLIQNLVTSIPFVVIIILAIIMLTNLTKKKYNTIWPYVIGNVLFILGSIIWVFIVTAMGFSFLN